MRRVTTPRLLTLGLLTLSLTLGLGGCTQTLSEADCGKYKDRLRVWAEKKGRVDPGAADAFMKSCIGASVSRSTARCLENAQDETAFVKCLE